MRQNEYEEIRSAVECIQDVIRENLSDIGDDQCSTYAQKRLSQNKNLVKAIFYLEELVNPTHGYAE